MIRRKFVLGLSALFFPAPAFAQVSFDTLRNNELESWILTILIVILIFLIIREILCWYWKINERLDVLYKISEQASNTNALLKALIKQLQGGGSDPPAQTTTPVIAPRVLPQSGQSSEKPLRPVTEKKHYFSKSILFLSSWIKSVSKNFLNILINWKRPIIIVTLLLVIGASVVILTPIAMRFWALWYN